MIQQKATGGAAVRRCSSCEEIPHFQGQRTPRRTVDAEVVAVQCWSNFEDVSHNQGQRKSPSETVESAKWHLKSNPTPARDAQRAQTNLVCTSTQRPHRGRDRAVFECLLRRCGSAVDCRRGRGSGGSRLGYGISPLGGVTINHTRTYTGREKQTLGGCKQNLVCTRFQEKGAVAPQETDPDLPVSVQEPPLGL